VALLSGAGGLTVAVDGTMIHTRTYPYQIRKYSEQGSELARLDVAEKVSTPEEFGSVTNNNGIETHSTNPNTTRPVPAKQLPDGSFIGGLIANGTYTMQRISSHGSTFASMKVPASWDALAIVDAVRKTFWFIGTDNDEPVLWKVPFGPDTSDR
jgi:hypothetical protein